MKNLPLHEFHEANGAKFEEVGGWLLPVHYGNAAEDLLASRKSCALIDRSYLGKLLLSGSDVQEFINQITTNDMSKLLAGFACDTLFSTPRGQVLDYCRVLNLGDAYLLISNDSDSSQLEDWINRFITFEDVKVTDAGNQYLWLTLVGPESFNAIQSLSAGTFTAQDETIWLEHEGYMFSAFRNDNFYTAAYDICLADTFEMETLDWILEGVHAAGGGLAGIQTFEVLRIESGLPCRKRELCGEYNPHEARLLKAVSFTKGAYTGQETISWLDTDGTVQRYLMIVEMKEKPKSHPPITVRYNDDPIGKLTSLTYDPISQKHVGLAYIDRPYTVEGLNLAIEVDGMDHKINGGLRPPLRR